MNLTINNKEYQIKYTIRSMFIFEQITGKPFSIDTMMDNYVFLYSMILASNPDNTIEWDTFIDAIDNDRNLIAQFNQIILDYKKKTDLLSDSSDNSNNVKKKSV